MHHYHASWLLQGAFSEAEFLRSERAYPLEHRRAIEAAEALKASKSPEEAFLLMSQTWRAFGEATEKVAGRRAMNAVFIAWVPAVQACFDAIPAIRAALKARHEAPDPAFDAVMKEIESIVGGGVVL